MSPDWLGRPGDFKLTHYPKARRREDRTRDALKTYVATTGTLFGLITLAHVLRMSAERHLATDPWYLLLTAAAAALSVWAFRLLRARNT
jgi:hypothetical protein